MSNHFHLLLETPEPNLVSGMKWLLGGFSQAWNRRYKHRGYVFQGRYKSIPVSGECATDPYHFRIVADYIHLNPSRAKIVGGTKGALIDYRWSSLPAYSKGKGPEWLVFDRVLEAFALAKSGRGRRAYVEWLEIRAQEDGGQLPDHAMQALRKGWYLGEDTFRDKLLALIEKGAKTLRVKVAIAEQLYNRMMSRLRSRLSKLGCNIGRCQTTKSCGKSCGKVTRVK